MEIRRIRSNEWRELRELRLRALLDSPDAFGATHEQEANDHEDEWRTWTRQGAEGGLGFTAVAAEGDRWVGMAVGAPHLDHPGDVGLFAMWVDPTVRGLGVGRALVDEVLDWARYTGFSLIRLRVTVSNGAAVRLYVASGFLDTKDRAPLREGSDVITMTMTMGLL
jgi:ribosomal protein S18 acetylase RimI-like enzyme